MSFMRESSIMVFKSSLGPLIVLQSSKVEMDWFHHCCSVWKYVCCIPVFLNSGFFHHVSILIIFYWFYYSFADVFLCSSSWFQSRNSPGHEEHLRDAHRQRCSSCGITTAMVKSVHLNFWRLGLLVAPKSSQRPLLNSLSRRTFT
jgi:hypothetical protein